MESVQVITGQKMRRRYKNPKGNVLTWYESGKLLFQGVQDEDFKRAILEEGVRLEVAVGRSDGYKPKIKIMTIQLDVTTSAPEMQALLAAVDGFTVDATASEGAAGKKYSREKVIFDVDGYELYADFYLPTGTVKVSAVADQYGQVRVKEFKAAFIAKHGRDGKGPAAAAADDDDGADEVGGDV